MSEQKNMLVLDIYGDVLQAAGPLPLRVFFQKKEINCMFHLSIPDVKLSRNYPVPALMYSSRRLPHCYNNTGYHLGFITLQRKWITVSFKPCTIQSYFISHTMDVRINPYVHCMKNEILFSWFYIMPLLFHVRITVFSGYLISDKQGYSPTLRLCNNFLIQGL